MRPIEFHPEALEELLQARSWYDDRFEGLGSEFIVEVEHAIEKIQKFPQRWPPYDEEGARRFLVHRFPFAIIYQFDEKAIQVLAVMHLHRRPGYWKDRKI